jgi:hypothetical protein
VLECTLVTYNRVLLNVMPDLILGKLWSVGHCAFLVFSLGFECYLELFEQNHSKGKDRSFCFQFFTRYYSTLWANIVPVKWRLFDDIKHFAHVEQKLVSFC